MKLPIASLLVVDALIQQRACCRFPSARPKASVGTPFGRSATVSLTCIAGYFLAVAGAYQRIWGLNLRLGAGAAPARVKARQDSMFRCWCCVAGRKNPRAAQQPGARRSAVTETPGAMPLGMLARAGVFAPFAAPSDTAARSWPPRRPARIGAGLLGECGGGAKDGNARDEDNWMVEGTGGENHGGVIQVAAIKRSVSQLLGDCGGGGGEGAGDEQAERLSASKISDRQAGRAGVVGGGPVQLIKRCMSDLQTKTAAFAGQCSNRVAGRGGWDGGPGGDSDDDDESGDDSGEEVRGRRRVAGRERRESVCAEGRARARARKRRLASMGGAISALSGFDRLVCEEKSREQDEKQEAKSGEHGAAPRGARRCYRVAIVLLSYMGPRHVAPALTFPSHLHASVCCLVDVVK